MIPLKVFQRLREEQKELAVRIGRLEQFIDNHDNKGTNEELNDDYMDILRDQLDAMKDYNTCLVQRIGIAVTDGIAPQERSRGNQAIRRDVNKFRETDPRDLAPKHELGDKVNPDEIVADEDERNFGFYCGFDTSIL